MNIIAVGDIMPGGLLNKTHKKYLTNEVCSLLESGDLRIGTLETAIGNQPTFFEEKMKRKADVIYAEDDDLLRLKEMDINIVSLANNHFFDLGPEGAAHTIRLLDKLGIQHCGAGNNIYEAQKPVVIKNNEKTYAFLAFCDYREETTGWCPFATEKSPGVNPLYEDYTLQQIRNAKKCYNYVIVIPHWGIEHTILPTTQVHKLANMMVKAGADIIIGSHTHHVQPYIKKHNKLILYSQGNFLFPDRLIVMPRSTYYPKEPLKLKDIPLTEGYPFVKETTLKRWKKKSRIGLITYISVNPQIKYTTFLTYISYDSIIGLLTGKDLYITRVRLIFIKCLIILGIYTYFRRCRDLLASIKRTYYEQKFNKN